MSYQGSLSGCVRSGRSELQLTKRFRVFLCTLKKTEPASLSIILEIRFDSPVLRTRFDDRAVAMVRMPCIGPVRYGQVFETFTGTLSVPIAERVTSPSPVKF